MAPWNTPTVPILKQPDSRKLRKYSEFLDSGEWAIQDSNLGPLPYQRKAMPRCGRKCPVFIEVSEASAAVKWRGMFRQSSVTPAPRAPADAGRPWRPAACSSAPPSFVDAGAEPRCQRRTAIDWQVRSLGTDAGVVERRMAPPPTRPRQTRLTRPSPHRRTAQSEAGFKLGPVFESSFPRRQQARRLRRAGASGAAAVVAAGLAAIAASVGLSPWPGCWRW